MKIIHRKHIFITFVSVKGIVLVSVRCADQQYFWPAAWTLSVGSSNSLFLIATGQSETYLCSTTIILDMEQLRLTLSCLCFVVSQLPPPSDSSCYPYSDSWLIVLVTYSDYMSSFSCGLFRHESEWRMGEDLGQLTSEQLASTIMATFMSCPGGLWNVDAVRGLLSKRHCSRLG